MNETVKRWRSRERERERERESYTLEDSISKANVFCGVIKKRKLYVV